MSLIVACNGGHVIWRNLFKCKYFSIHSPVQSNFYPSPHVGRGSDGNLTCRNREFGVLILTPGETIFTILSPVWITPSIGTRGKGGGGLGTDKSIKVGTTQFEQLL